MCRSVFGVFEAYAVPLNGFYHFGDGFVLSDDHLSHVFRHPAQLLCFCLHHSFHRDTGHHAHYFSNGFFVDGVAFMFAFFLPF